MIITLQPLCYENVLCGVRNCFVPCEFILQYQPKNNLKESESFQYLLSLSKRPPPVCLFRILQMHDIIIVYQEVNIMDYKKPINIFYLVVISISLIAITVLLISYPWKHKAKDNTSASSSSQASVEKEEKGLVTTSIDTVEEGLRNMGFLITQEYYFTQVEKYSKEKTILNLFPADSEFSYSYEGCVTAGIDFNRISLTRDEQTKSIIVDIPPSEIKNVDIDTSTFQVFSEKDSIWNPINLEDYNISLTEFEENAKNKALENGILQRSDEQAKTLITNFIENSPSTSGYEVEFKQ